MARLIDADKLADEFYHMPELVYTDAIARCIEMQPKVDAVQVVRCKDCKYWYDGMWGKYCTLDHIEHSESHYCADAEPNDEEDCEEDYDDEDGEQDD